jgi:hypothetical protein
MNWMPHGACFGWDKHVLVLRVASDAIIALSYFSIPAALLYFLRRHPQVHLAAVFSAFASFIVSCGLTHVFDIITIWHPVYVLDAWMRVICAITSLATAFALWWAMPLFKELWRGR